MKKNRRTTAIRPEWDLQLLFVNSTEKHAMRADVRSKRGHCNHQNELFNQDKSGSYQSCECAIKWSPSSWWINMANSDESHSTRRTPSPTHNSAFLPAAQVCKWREVKSLFGQILCWQDARSNGGSDRFLQRQLLYFLLASRDNAKHSGVRAPATHIILPALQLFGAAARKEKSGLYLCAGQWGFWPRVFITRLPGFAQSTPGDESFKRIWVEQSPMLICTLCFKRFLTGWNLNLPTTVTVKQNPFMYNKFIYIFFSYSLTSLNLKLSLCTTYAWVRFEIYSILYKYFKYFVLLNIIILVALLKNFLSI